MNYSEFKAPVSVSTSPTVPEKSTRRLSAVFIFIMIFPSEKPTCERSGCESCRENNVLLLDSRSVIHYCIVFIFQYGMHYLPGDCTHRNGCQSISNKAVVQSRLVVWLHYTCPSEKKKNINACQNWFIHF